MKKEHINTQNSQHTETVAQNQPYPEEQQGSLLTINATIMFIAISFVIFTIIMQKVLYGPITKIRQKRKEYLKGIKAEAAKANEEAESLNKEYNQKIYSARKTASEKTTKAINETNQEKNKILEEKKQDLMKFIEEERQKIHSEKAESFENLKENISEYAYEISKKILKEEIPIIGVSKEAIENAIDR